MEPFVFIFTVLFLFWLAFGVIFMVLDKTVGTRILLFPLFLYREYLEFKKETTRRELEELNQKKKQLLSDIENLNKEAEKLIPYIKNTQIEIQFKRQIKETKKLLKENNKTQCTSTSI